MDTLKTIGIPALVALVVVMGFSLMASDKDGIGGVPGVSILPQSQYPAAFSILATSTRTNSTLLASDLITAGWIDHTLTNADGTLTFPASSSFPGIPNTGDMREIWVRNATTTAGIDLTVAVGTGMTLKDAASSTPTLVGDTDGDNAARLIFIRKPDTDINVYLTKYED